MVKKVQFKKNEITIGMCSKDLIRASVQVLLMKNRLKCHKRILKKLM